MRKQIFILLFGLGCVATGRAADPERSVVQIMTFVQQPIWDAPWRFEPVHKIGGSGFVIKGKRIMTNAHVVSWGRQVQVHRYQDPRPYAAEVEYVGHDCDLAVLTVQDPRFFENLEPLELGELPKVRTTVVTYGYPMGGEEISYTRGVVSRIQLEPYAHIGNRQLLTVQTDAAINPGNSGGPVIQDDRVVGVAFQGTPGLENTGFFIPPPVIEHFLRDISNHRYDGFPQAGVRVVPLQSPAYRDRLKLTDDSLGARVDGFVAGTDADKVLKLDDVILKAGDYPVASDATILYQGNRLSAALAFQFAQSGESVPLQIWRDGRQMEVSLPVKAYDMDRAAGYQYSALPRYYVHGGLVFTPLSLDYLRTLGRNAPDSVNGEMYYELYYHRQEDPATSREEPVVLASVLADAVNANVAARGRTVVDRINGIRIEKLEDAVRAFDTNTNAYDVVEFLPHHNAEYLERAEVAKANPRILQNYKVSNDRRL